MFKCNKFWHSFKCKTKERTSESGTAGFAYVLGFFGALAYYWSTATSLWAVIVGFIQAVLWPAFLVYGLLVFMGI